MKFTLSVEVKDGFIYYPGGKNEIEIDTGLNLLDKVRKVEGLEDIDPAAIQIDFNSILRTDIEVTESDARKIPKLFKKQNKAHLYIKKDFVSRFIILEIEIMDIGAVRVSTGIDEERLLKAIIKKYGPTQPKRKMNSTKSEKEIDLTKVLRPGMQVYHPYWGLCPVSGIWPDQEYPIFIRTAGGALESYSRTGALDNKKPNGSRIYPSKELQSWSDTGAALEAINANNKTVIGWISGMEESRLKRRILKQLRPANAQKIVQSLEDALISAFRWSNSPQGATYWRLIFHKIKHGELK